MQSLKVSKEQLTEWTENPVTLNLLSLIEAQRESIDNTPIHDAYERGRPEVTQENMVALVTMALDYGDFADFLRGNWDILMEDEDEE